jgi:MFS family permease
MIHYPSSSSSSSSSVVRVFSSGPVFSLLVARVLYAINWFNISSIFYLIAIDFGQDISMLGLITASFLVGIGIFQVPAGILAAKYGPKKIAVLGIMVASIASLLSAGPTELFQMVILRFIVGIGMALFFGPSVILITNYLARGSEGLGVSILNSAQALGAIIGIFGWIVISQTFGWRVSLVISGTLGILTGVFLIIAILAKDMKERKRDMLKSMKDIKEKEKEKDYCYHRQSTSNQISICDIKQILFNKQLIALGLALLGVQIGWNLISTFIVFYLNGHLHVNPTIAGLIGSLALISTLISSPIFGMFYDRMKESKKLLSLCAVAMSIGISVLTLNTFYAVVFSVIVVGIFAAGGFVVPYAKAREVNKIHNPMYQTLAVGYVNGISLFGAFWVPFVFSVVVRQSEYSIAWMLGSVLILTFLLPYIKTKDSATDDGCTIRVRLE